MAIDVSIFHKYNDNEISLIPVHGKVPIIKNWSLYSNQEIPEEEVDSWVELPNVTGFGIVLGKRSNICAIDVDTQDPELLKKMLEMLPHSPIRKVGKKGETRLFRVFDTYDNCQNIPFNKKQYKRDGEVIADLLIEGSQTVIPPSMYYDKDGHYLPEYDYRWLGDELTADYDITDLPVLRINEVDRILSDFSNKLEGEFPHESQGRNDTLSSLAGKYIKQKLPLDIAVGNLIEYDKRNHAIPLFTDPSENMPTSHAGFNALNFYVRHLKSVNQKRERTGKELELPISKVAISDISNDLSWSDPLPVIKDFDIPDFDESLIPENWRNWITEMSKSNGLNPMMTFFMAISIVSSLIGNKAYIQPNENQSTYRLAHNLYVMIIALSGSRKTQAYKIASWMLNKIQNGIIEGEKEENNINKNKMAINRVKVKTLKSMLLDAVKDNANEKTITEIQEKISKLEEEGKPPVGRRLVFNTITPEALADHCGAHQNGVLLFENELGGLEAKMKKQGYEHLRTMLLNGWDNEPYNYDTKHQGNVHIDELCFSMITNAQPSVFKSIIDQSVMVGKSDDGLIQRSLLVFSNPNKSYIPTNKPIKFESFMKAYDIFQHAFNLPDDKKVIHASLEASETYSKFVKKINDEIFLLQKIGTKESEALAPFYSKMLSNVPKMASIFDFINNGGVLPTLITEESMSKAIRIVLEYNIPHIKNAMALSDYSSNGMLLEIISMIKTKMITDGMTLRDIFRSNQKYFKTARVVHESLCKLEKLACIKIYADGGSKRIAINPKLLD